MKYVLGTLGCVIVGAVAIVINVNPFTVLFFGCDCFFFGWCFAIAMN